MNKFPSPDTILKHRISYGETDAMGIVYYAQYLHFFERARARFIRKRGMSYAKVEEQGFYLPVRQAHARYKSPARYDDLILIRTGISEWKKVSMTFCYEIYDQNQKKILVTGYTQHACTDKTGRPVAIPAWLKELFEKQNPE